MKITSSLNDQLMALAAFRYCLGSQSYIVGACLDWLDEHWEQIELSKQSVIVRDIVEALMDGRAGSSLIDAPGWKRLAENKFALMTREQQEFVKRAVAYKDKSWPLG